jgi:DNA-binding transcriptional regulator YhcF (GntR family)
VINLFRINREWPLAPAEQLKAGLRTAIRSGELAPGTALPRVRALAMEVGVNANTIAAAYRGLAREGLVVARRRGGTQVAPGPFPQSSNDVAILEAADDLVALAHRHRLGGGDLIRLVAGRWDAKSETASLAGKPRDAVYDFLRIRDHDQG